MPRLQSVRPGDTAEMYCHVTGEPFPDVVWLKNDEPLNFNRLKVQSQSDNITAKSSNLTRNLDEISGVQTTSQNEFDKYEVRGNGSSLKIFNIDYSDTGSCTEEIKNYSKLQRITRVYYHFRSLYVSGMQYWWNCTRY